MHLPADGFKRAGVRGGADDLQPARRAVFHIRRTWIVLQPDVAQRDGRAALGETGAAERIVDDVVVRVMAR